MKNSSMTDPDARSAAAGTDREIPSPAHSGHDDYRRATTACLITGQGSVCVGSGHGPHTRNDGLASRRVISPMAHTMSGCLLTATSLLARWRLRVLLLFPLLIAIETTEVQNIVRPFGALRLGLRHLLEADVTTYPLGSCRLAFFSQGRPSM